MSTGIYRSARHDFDRLGFGVIVAVSMKCEVCPAIEHASFVDVIVKCIDLLQLLVEASPAAVYFS